MAIQNWWPRLPQTTRDWLIGNNGSAVPDIIRDQIEHAGGPARNGLWWTVDAEGTAGVTMPDAAVDWIEAAANSE